MGSAGLAEQAAAATFLTEDGSIIEGANIEGVWLATEAKSDRTYHSGNNYHFAWMNEFYSDRRGQLRDRDLNDKLSPFTWFRMAF